MNILAHAYLSFRDPDTLVGNLISDFVKGKKKFDYSLPIQRGIELHRAIDDFTDHHPATKAAMEVFRPTYRLYCGAFVDVAYDHFLARDDSEFPGNGLAEFAAWVYETADQYRGSMPENFERMLPYMRSQNWLLNYASLQGMDNSFNGLVRRSANLTDSAPASALFREHYQLLGDCYRHFWADVLPFARDRYQSLANLPG